MAATELEQQLIPFLSSKFNEVFTTLIQSNYDELFSNYQEIFNAFNQLKSDHDKLKEDNDKLKEDNDKLKEDNDKLNENNDKLKGESTLNQDEIQKLSEQIQSFKSEPQSPQNPKLDAYNELRADFDKLEEEHIKTKHENALKQEEIQTLIEQMQSFKSDHDKLKQDNNELKGENTLKDDEIERLNKEIESSQTQSPQKQKEQKTENKNEEILNEYNQLKADFDKLKDQSIKIKAENASKEEEIQTLSAQIQSFKSQTQSPQKPNLDAYNELRADFDKLKHANIKTKADNALKQEEIEELIEQIQSVKSLSPKKDTQIEINALKHKVRTLEYELASAQTELKDYRSKSSKEMNSYQRQIRELKQERKHMQFKNGLHAKSIKNQTNLKEMDYQQMKQQYDALSECHSNNIKSIYLFLDQLKYRCGLLLKKYSNDDENSEATAEHNANITISTISTKDIQPKLTTSYAHLEQFIHNISMVMLEKDTEHLGNTNICDMDVLNSDNDT